MGRAKTAVRRSPLPSPGSVNEREAKKKRSGNKTSGQGPMAGLRERKKARLRQQIVETALHLASQRFSAISPAKTRSCARWVAVHLPARPKA